MHLAAARSGARRMAVTIAVLSLAVAACGGDDDETTDTTGTTDTPSVDSSAVDTTEAEVDGSATTVAGTDTASPATTEGGTGTSDAAGDGDDVDRSEEAFVTAGAEALALGDEEQSRCIAQAIVDAVGYDQLEAAGITPEEFNSMPSLSEAGLVVDDAAGPQLQSDLLACGDLIEALASSPAVTPEQADCAREHLTDELVAESFVIRVLESEPSPEYVEAATNAQECATS